MNVTKKLFRSMVMIMLTLLPLTASAQEISAADAEKMLTEYAEEKTKACPIKEEEGSYIVMMGYEEHQMNIAYGVDHENYELVKNNQNLSKIEYCKELVKDKEKLGMATLLVIANSSLSLVFFDRSIASEEAMKNPVVLVFPVEELGKAISEAEKEK